MKLLVERMLTEIRGQLRQMPTNIKVVKNTTERQKLLVSVTQEFVRHLNDCIRGEYRDRLMVRHAELRLYTLAMKKFLEFQGTVGFFSPLFC
jgi:interferon-induced GTP-binding protein Mx1